MQKFIHANKTYIQSFKQCANTNNAYIHAIMQTEHTHMHIYIYTYTYIYIYIYIYVCIRTYRHACMLA